MTDKFQMEAGRAVRTVSACLETESIAEMMGAEVGAQFTTTFSSTLTCSYMLTTEIVQHVDGPAGWPVNGIMEHDPDTGHMPDCFLNQSPRWFNEHTEVCYLPYGSWYKSRQKRIFA